MSEFACKCPACVPDTDCTCQEIEVKVCPRHGALAIPAAVHNLKAQIAHLEAELRRERYLGHLAAEVVQLGKNDDLSQNAIDDAAAKAALARAESDRDSWQRIARAEGKRVEALRDELKRVADLSNPDPGASR